MNLSKIKAIIKPFLIHPIATLIIALTGLVNALTAIATLASQMGVNLGPLAPYFHGGADLALKCMVISAICTALAGMGRSFISFVDNIEGQNAKPIK